MTIRSLLDDAAAEAVTTLRVDLAAAQDRAAHRRRNVRAVLGAAAAAVLMALAVPLLVDARSTSPAAPAERREGLPDRWYSAPEFAPPVTRAHMTAASLVLQGANYFPVLVSSDARTYATLPGWGSEDGLVALSRDGRRVAWVTDGATVVVHIVELATGRRTDVPLPVGRAGPQIGGTGPDQLVWADGSLYARIKTSVWQIDGLVPAELGRCGASLGRDGDGRLVLISMAGALAACDERVRAARGSVDGRLQQLENPPGRALPVASPLAVVSPPDRQDTGARVAGDEYVAAAVGWRGATARLAFSGQRAKKTIDLGTAAGALPLAWTGAGVLVRLDAGTAGDTEPVLLLVDPGRRTSRVVSRRMENAVPVAAAPGLILRGTPIPAQPPEFPALDRDRVRHGLDAVLHVYVLTRETAVVGVVVLAAGAVLLVGRRRRRRRSVLRG